MNAQPTRPGPALDALRAAARDLAQAESVGRAAEVSTALGAMAEAYAGAGEHEMALAAYEAALRLAAACGAADLRGQWLCALAECSADAAARFEADAAARAAADDADEAASADATLPGLRAAGRCERAHQAREQARDRAFEACAAAGAVSDPRWEGQLLLRASDVLDRCGDHDDAAGVHDRAMRLLAGDDMPTAGLHHLLSDFAALTHGPLAD